MKDLATSVRRICTPLGTMLATATNAGIRVLTWDPSLARVASSFGGGAAHLDALASQLDAYFARGLTDFDLPLDPVGTPFQRAAWEALARVPYGTTRSYGEQAEAMGRPDAVRAVGRANGRNPIAIVLPCHRIVGANGSLTGYAGGLERKARLLALERGQGELF